MWHTSSGDRTLAGAEALLAKEALTGIVELTMEERGGYADQWEYDIRRFDELTVSQRLRVLEQVATYVLTPTADTLELTAVNEAAVAVLFEHVLVELDWEIDNDEAPTTRWRSMILDAYRESCGADQDLDDDDDEFPLPAVNSDDRQAWSDLVEALVDGILWDRDFEMEEFLDVAPEKSAMLKQLMGIEDDYYSAPAPDVSSDSDIDQTTQRLESLLK